MFDSSDRPDGGRGATTAVAEGREAAGGSCVDMDPREVKEGALEMGRRASESETRRGKNEGT